MTTSPGGDRQLRGGAPGGAERAHVRREAGPPHPAPYDGGAKLLLFFITLKPRVV